MHGRGFLFSFSFLACNSEGLPGRFASCLEQIHTRGIFFLIFGIVKNGRCDFKTCLNGRLDISEQTRLVRDEYSENTVSRLRESLLKPPFPLSVVVFAGCSHF